jgi:predicted permease
MFSVLDALLLKPLPYIDPDRLAMLWTEIPTQSVREGRSAYWNVEQWRGQSRSFEDIAVFDPASVTLTTADASERITVLRVSPNLFSVLGVQPLVGRIFSVEEAARRQQIALISHRLWQTRFGGTRDAIGKTVELDGISSEIIGVLPETSEYPLRGADVLEAHSMLPDWETGRLARGAGAWFVLGRLQPNVTLDQAQVEMNAIAARLREQMPPGERNSGISIVSLGVQVTGARARLALWLLTGAVFCVLLIAAGNVASLSLARSAGREREISIRAALGASRGRIARQLLAESLTLAAISGVLGLLIALAGIRLTLAFRPADLVRLDGIGLDPRVLVGAVVICLFTGILVGLAPAITMARRTVRPSGSDAGRGNTAGVSTRGIRRALVVAEFALAIVLLVGAGLLIRSLWSLDNVDPGFRPDRVLLVSLSTAALGSDAPRADFFNRVLEQVESLPGVESAGIIGDFFVGGNPEQILTIEGSPTTSALVRFRRDEVSGGFFRTVGTPLLKGRFFTAEDRADSTPVAIVNEAMARRLWPGRDPVGDRFKLGAADSRNPWVTVVGVVGDMRRQGLENEPIPQIFEPLAQNPGRLANLLVRTSTDAPLRLTAVVEDAVRRVEKYAPVYGVTTLENRLGDFLTERRFQSSLLIAFSVIALVMAAIGIYGLMHYSIATRTREIGVRLAAGAQARDIFALVIREGVMLSVTGLIFGLAGALWLGRAGRSLLFGVTATDPITLIAVSLLLITTAIAACYFPARRAMKVEPVAALRQD